MKKFAQHQTVNPPTADAVVAPTPGGDVPPPPAASKMPAAALAALARINSRLNLKTGQQQQQPGNSYSNAKELATAAAGEISKQLQQAKTNGSGDTGSGEMDMDMDLDESNKQDFGAAESGPVPTDSAPPTKGEAPTNPTAAPLAAGAPTPATAPTAAAGAPKPGAAPVIVQGSIPGLPTIPKGLPSLSAIKSSKKLPPPNAQTTPRAENPPSANVSVPEQTPSLPLPSPEAPAGETTLI